MTLANFCWRWSSDDLCCSCRLGLVGGWGKYRAVAASVCVTGKLSSTTYVKTSSPFGPGVPSQPPSGAIAPLVTGRPWGSGGLQGRVEQLKTWHDGSDWNSVFCDSASGLRRRRMVWFRTLQLVCVVGERWRLLSALKGRDEPLVFSHTRAVPQQFKTRNFVH